MKSSKGFSIPELLLVCGLFSAFSVVAYYLLALGLGLWSRVESSQDVSEQLLKARDMLLTDLSETSINELIVSRFSNSSDTFQAGDVLCLLSPQDPIRKEVGRRGDGTAYWQRNLLYYSAVPSDHGELFPVGCAGRYATCPHKFLIRRILDTGPVTRYRSALADVERLLPVTSLEGELLVPEDFHSDLRSPESGRTALVASGILDFSVRLAPPDGLPGEVEVTLKGFDVREAGKKVNFRETDLETSPYTHTVKFSVFPRNTEES